VPAQSVQLAGMSDRLPSGRTTSNTGVPRRLMADITANERPSNGCRSRTIATERVSRRWVVCDNFLDSLDWELLLKRLRHKTKGARDWFARLVRANPKLFAHCELCHGNGRTTGAV
jgi:hypothetical protein